MNMGTLRWLAENEASIHFKEEGGVIRVTILKGDMFCTCSVSGRAFEQCEFVNNFLAPAVESLRDAEKFT